MSQNIFILSVDSLHYRGIASAVSDLQTLTEGVAFTNAVAPASETGSAIPALAAGVYDDTLSGRGMPESEGPELIFEVAAEHGFETALWSDNVLFGSEYNYDRGLSAGNAGAPTKKKRLAQRIKNSWLRPIFGTAEWGYFNVVQPIIDTTTGYSPFYRSASDLNTSAYDWLDSSDRRTGHLCWLHYMDTHHPYEPPDEYLSEVSLTTTRSRSELGELSRQLIKADDHDHDSDELTDVRAAYEACCRYVGDEITEFVNRLHSNGYFDPERDILVFTADHGECLRPSVGMLGHTPPAFYEEILNVPLMVACPDWPKEKVTQQVSLIDLMPTVLDLADLPVPESTEGTAASTPSALQRDIAVSMTKNPDDDGWKVFRCARAATGNKVFGQFDDRILFTSYKADDEYDRETVVDQDQMDGNQEWQELVSAVDNRGGALERTERIDTDREVHKEHLRDLGYLE